MTTSVNPKAPMTQPTSTDQRSSIEKLAQQDAAHLALDQAHAKAGGGDIHDQVMSTAIMYMGAAVAASANPQQALNALHVALGMTTVADTTGLNLAAPTNGGRRIAPALVRAGDRTMRIHIDCFDWCTENHLSEALAIEDITHHAASVCLEVDSLTKLDYPTHVFEVALYANPASSDERQRVPHLVVVDEATSEEAILNADMGDILADRMLQAAAKIRSAACAARQAVQP